MGIADDIIRQTSTLADNRAEWDAEWNKVARFVLPRSMDFTGEYSGGNLRPIGRASSVTQAGRPRATKRSREIYDSVPRLACDRFASAMESLAVPRGQKWHGVEFDDEALNDNDAGAEWRDTLTDGMFRIRYGGHSGFPAAIQQIMRGIGAFGNQYLYLERAYGLSPISYVTIPLPQSYPVARADGEIDTFYRRFSLPAVAARRKFGEAVSAKIVKAAEHETDKFKQFEFIHCVKPRDEFKPRQLGINASDFESYYIEVRERHLVEKGGYFEFPYIPFRMPVAPGEVYAEGPAMVMLADIQTANRMGKTNMRAAQQATDPALAARDERFTGRRVRLDPGYVNYGAIDANGNLGIRPIMTGARPDIGEQAAEVKRNSIREGFYNNLFQIVVNNPSMTATEVLARAQEKSEMLGPLGGGIQASLAKMFERELAILERAGLYRDLPPPRELANASFTVSFKQSPLDRLRRAEEAAGTLRVLEVAGQLAAIDPEVTDNIDGDAVVRTLSDIYGAPAKILRRREEVEETREERRQARQNQAAIDAAAQLAPAAQQGAAALRTIQQAGQAA